MLFGTYQQTKQEKTKNKYETSRIFKQKGIIIFNEIATHLERAGIEEVDSYKLSMLADAFDDYSEFTKNIKKDGVINKHDQISGMVTARDKALQSVIKLSPSFGIDISSREKISAFANNKEQLADIG